MQCDVNCRVCMKRMPIFALLDNSTLDIIVKNMTFHFYKKGHIIHAQGDTSDTFTVICSGSAKAAVITADGKEKILYLFGEKDYFGEAYLFGTQQAAYTVTVLEPMKSAVLHKSYIEKLLLQHPTLSAQLIEDMGERIIKLEAIIHGTGMLHSQERVNAMLLDFYNKFGNKSTNDKVINLPLSREGIASYIGITRETLSRKLNRLEKDGIIRAEGNKKIIILQPERLNIRPFDTKNANH